MYPNDRSSAVIGYPSPVTDGHQAVLPSYVHPVSPSYLQIAQPAAQIAAAPLPAVDFRSVQQRAISGRYEGGRAAANVVADILDLRIDVDPRYGPDSPVLNKISGDFYTQRLGGTTTGSVPRRTYVESWIVDEPVVVWFADHAEITGTVRFWQGNRPVTTVRVTVAWTGGTVQPAIVEIRAAGITSAFQCAYRSLDFRSVTMELDYAASVDEAPRMPTYDTHAHQNRPADLTQRTLSIETAYREAGIGLTIPTDHTVIDDSAAGFDTWSPAELHDAMETAFSRIGNDWPEWNLWGMQAGKYENPRTGGIMFDAAAGLGGAGRSPERQGFAVFRDHSWFADLVDGPPANQDQARAMRQFLYTWVHEAGHAFNFLHSWDKSRPNSLSWMNYDWKYDLRNGTDQFWANFRFRFDDEELIHLRHGDRAAVIMGGDPWSGGGHLDAPGRANLDPEPDQPLELLLRPNKYYAYMEPVEIEFRLRNMTDQPLPVDARLDPTYGVTKVYILKPDGKTMQFASVMCLYGTPNVCTLAPATSHDGLERHSAMVPLTFGARGFVFDVPGQYQLRAVYSTGNLLAVSNTAVLWIGQPTTKEEDLFAADFFSPEVGMTLCLGGSMSPYLESGVSTLQEAAERFAGDELGAKAAAVVADSVGKDFYRRDVAGDADKMVKHHAADPAAALEATEPTVQRYHETADQSLNITYNDLVTKRAELHVRKGDPELARQELLALADDLDGRAVNPNVTSDVRAKAEDVAAATTTAKPRRKSTPRRKTAR